MTGYSSNTKRHSRSILCCIYALPGHSESKSRAASLMYIMALKCSGDPGSSDSTHVTLQSRFVLLGQIIFCLGHTSYSSAPQQGFGPLFHKDFLEISSRSQVCHCTFLMYQILLSPCKHKLLDQKLSLIDVLCYYIVFCNSHDKKEIILCWLSIYFPSKCLWQLFVISLVFF